MELFICLKPVAQKRKGPGLWERLDTGMRQVWAVDGKLMLMSPPIWGAVFAQATLFVPGPFLTRGMTFFWMIHFSSSPAMVASRKHQEWKMMMMNRAC